MVRRVVQVPWCTSAVQYYPATCPTSGVQYCTAAVYCCEVQHEYTEALVLVVVVPLVADRVAEAERENDAQELHGDHSDDDPDDDVQAADQVVVDPLVAALKDTVHGKWEDFQNLVLKP